MATLLLLIPKALLDAWALWLLWAWFVVPIGVSRLGYWQAFGIDALLGLIVLSGVTVTDDDDDKRLSLMVGKMIVVPIIVGSAWVALQIWKAQS